MLTNDVIAMPSTAGTQTRDSRSLSKLPLSGWTQLVRGKTQIIGFQIYRNSDNYFRARGVFLVASTRNQVSRNKSGIKFTPSFVINAPSHPVYSGPCLCCPLNVLLTKNVRANERMQQGDKWHVEQQNLKINCDSFESRKWFGYKFVVRLQ